MKNVEKVKPGEDWKELSLERGKLKANLLDGMVLKAGNHEEEEKVSKLSICHCSQTSLRVFFSHMEPPHKLVSSKYHLSTWKDVSCGSSAIRDVLVLTLISLRWHCFIYHSIQTKFGITRRDLIDLSFLSKIVKGTIGIL